MEVKLVIRTVAVKLTAVRRVRLCPWTAFLLVFGHSLAPVAHPFSWYPSPSLSLSLVALSLVATGSSSPLFYSLLIIYLTALAPAAVHLCNTTPLCSRHPPLAAIEPTGDDTGRQVWQHSSTQTTPAPSWQQQRRQPRLPQQQRQQQRLPMPASLLRARWWSSPAARRASGLESQGASHPWRRNARPNHTHPSTPTHPRNPQPHGRQGRGGGAV